MAQAHEKTWIHHLPSASYYPSWYSPKAKHGGTASLTGDMQSWDIVGRARAATAFDNQIEAGTWNFGFVIGPDVNILCVASLC
jgi:hypothetical protein